MGLLPPVTGHQPFPYFAADSSPKQNRLSPFFPLAVSGLRLPSEALQRLRRPGRGPASPAGTGTVCLAPGPRSALTVAGEQALPWQLPEDGAQLQFKDAFG